MKRGFLILFFILLFMNIVLAVEVDSKVQEELNEEEKVSVIIKLKEEENDLVKAAVKEDVLSSLNEEEFNTSNEYTTINAISGQITQEGLDKLKSDSNVERIEFNYPVKAYLQDTINLINASFIHRSQFNNLNITGKDQTICIIDSGINYTHPALENKVLDGHCYQNDNAAFSTALCNDDSSEQAGIEGAIDDNGHGTHVSGIAAGNNTIIGVAPDSNLISIKALNASGDGTVGDVVRGIDWCVSNSTVYNISVISMSLGGGLYTSDCDSTFTSYRDSINNAIAKNITVVVATGNAGSTTGISAPACIKNATSVSSSTKTDGVSGFSNRNTITDLFAPGSSVNSSVPGDGCENCDSTLYKVLSGTSMATPHVAGAVAILRQFNNNLMPSEIEENLNITGRNIDDSGGSGFIFKIVDIFKAIIGIDDIKPLVTLNNKNNSFVNITTLNFNFTVEDHIINNCSLYNNVNGDFNLNQTINLTTSGTYNLSFVNLTENSYLWNVECTDYADNVNFNDTNFTIGIDTTIPLINYSIGLTQVELGVENTTINWSIVDTNLDTTFINITYSNGTLWNLFNENITLTIDNITEVGNYTILFFVNDSANNINTTQATIEFIQTFSTIILDYPQNITYDNENLNLNFTIDGNYTSIWYNLDNSSNITITDNITFSTTEGEHKLYLFINNSFEKESSISESFIVDLTDPLVSLSSPSNNTVSTSNDIDFKYSVDDFSINNCTLFLNNASQSVDSSVAINNTETISVDNLGDGDHDWYVSCKDYANREGNSTTFRLNISVSSSSGGGSGGSGGGGGGSGGGYSTPTINNNPVQPSIDLTNLLEQQAQPEEQKDDDGLSAITGEAVRGPRININFSKIFKNKYVISSVILVGVSSLLYVNRFPIQRIFRKIKRFRRFRY
tara:strand:- start:22981 stop:25698 length:2718 start_codon:yes stop_codon:yes gene_type:complete